jgi:hypothetical protein
MLDTVVFGIVALHVAVAVAEVVGVDEEEVGLLLCEGQHGRCEQ